MPKFSLRLIEKVLTRSSENDTTERLSENEEKFGVTHDRQVIGGFRFVTRL
jgi:hypothetical protein